MRTLPDDVDKFTDEATSWMDSDASMRCAMLINSSTNPPTVFEAVPAGGGDAPRSACRLRSSSQALQLRAPDGSRNATIDRSAASSSGLEMATSAFGSASSIMLSAKENAMTSSSDTWFARFNALISLAITKATENVKSAPSDDSACGAEAAFICFAGKKPSARNLRSSECSDVFIVSVDDDGRVVPPSLRTAESWATWHTLSIPLVGALAAERPAGPYASKPRVLFGTDLEAVYQLVRGLQLSAGMSRGEGSVNHKVRAALDSLRIQHSNALCFGGKIAFSRISKRHRSGHSVQAGHREQTLVSLSAALSAAFSAASLSKRYIDGRATVDSLHSLAASACEAARAQGLRAEWDGICPSLRKAIDSEAQILDGCASVLEALTRSDWFGELNGRDPLEVALCAYNLAAWPLADNVNMEEVVADLTRRVSSPGMSVGGPFGTRVLPLSLLIDNARMPRQTSGSSISTNGVGQIPSSVGWSDANWSDTSGSSAATATSAASVATGASCYGPDRGMRVLGLEAIQLETRPV